jgi:hypothetical protein
MSDVWSIDGTRNYHEGVDNFGNAHLDGNVDLSDVDDEQYECWQSRQARERERVGWGESTEQAAGVEYWREDEEMRQQDHYSPKDLMHTGNRSNMFPLTCCLTPRRAKETVGRTCHGRATMTQMMVNRVPGLEHAFCLIFVFVMREDLIRSSNLYIT